MTIHPFAFNRINPFWQRFERSRHRRGGNRIVDIIQIENSFESKWFREFCNARGCHTLPHRQCEGRSHLIWITVAFDGSCSTLRCSTEIKDFGNNSKAIWMLMSLCRRLYVTVVVVRTTHTRCLHWVRELCNFMQWRNVLGFRDIDSISIAWLTGMPRTKLVPGKLTPNISERKKKTESISCGWKLCGCVLNPCMCTQYEYTH